MLLLVRSGAHVLVTLRAGAPRGASHRIFGSIRVPAGRHGVHPTYNLRVDHLRSAFLGLLVLGATSCGSTSSDGSRTTPVGGTSGGSGHLASQAGASQVTLGAGAGAGRAGSAGVGGASLKEAEPSIPCVQDPLDSHWTEQTLPDTVRAPLVALGKGLAVLAYRDPQGALLVRTRIGQAEWTEPKDLGATPVTSLSDRDRATRLSVAPDGSGAVVLWSDGGGAYRASILSVPGTWGPAATMDFGTDSSVQPQLVMLSGGKAFAAAGTGLGILVMESGGNGAWLASSPVVTNFTGFFRTADNGLTAYGWSSLAAEGTRRYPYLPGTGFGPPEQVPVVAHQSVWRETALELPNGRAAYLVEGTPGAAANTIQVEVRTEGNWSAPAALPCSDSAFPPPIVHSGISLVAFDSQPEAVTARSHDGGDWGPAVTLPRSRALSEVAVAGSLSGEVLLVGSQVLSTESVDVVKLYRRGQGGEWYCPHLLPSGFGTRVASHDQGAFLVLVSSIRGHRIASFAP